MVLKKMETEGHQHFIENIVSDLLRRKGLSVGKYCKNIVKPQWPLDKIGLVLFAHLYKIHICVFVEGKFFTLNSLQAGLTRPNDFKKAFCEYQKLYSDLPKETQKAKENVQPKPAPPKPKNPKGQLNVKHHGIGKRKRLIQIFSALFVNKYLILDVMLIYMFIRSLKTGVCIVQRPTSIMPVNISMKVATGCSNINIKCAERNLNKKKITVHDRTHTGV